jgi:hypothetical protein
MRTLSHTFMLSLQVACNIEIKMLTLGAERRACSLRGVRDSTNDAQTETKDGRDSPPLKTFPHIRF